MRGLIVSTLALGLAACAATEFFSASPPPTVDGPAHSVASEHAAEWPAIRLAVRPVALSPARAGALTFAGGLELDGDDRNFGGLSGLEVDEGGNLVAVTDQGYWFAAKLVLDEEGALTGLVDPRLAPIVGPDGRAFTDKIGGDAEGLARLSDGRLAVSFERQHLVRIYDLDGKGPLAPPDLTLIPAGTDKLGANESFEALAEYGDRLLVGSERAPAGASGAGFWLAPLDPAVFAPMAGVAPTERQFGLVGLDRLPEGDYVALQRFYAPLIGPRLVVQRVDDSGLDERPANWRAITLAELGPPMDLDNFEGVAAVKTDRGTRLYLISDDNFRSAQRTLLYAFDLAE